MRSVAAILIVGSTTSLAAQSQSAKAPSFEVASIKVNASGDENWGFVPQPGVLLAINVTARQIANATCLSSRWCVHGVTGVPGRSCARRLWTAMLCVPLRREAWIRRPRMAA